MLRPSPPAKATAFHNGIFGRNGIFCMINRSADGSKIVGRNSLGTFTSYSPAIRAANSDTLVVRPSQRSPLRNQSSMRPAPSRRRLRNARGDGGANCSGEPVAAAELSADKVTIFAESLAQRENLNLQVLLRDNDAWPHPA